MAGRIILIDHHHNPGDDLVTSHLSKLGFKTELVCPFDGDRLPGFDNSICGAVIFGGTQNVTELGRYPFLQKEIDWITGFIETRLPLLGICLGAQLIAHALGARVGPHPDGQCEFGYYKITPTPGGRNLFPQSIYVTQAHHQQFEIPNGANVVATGDLFPNQAFVYNENVYALQFHPEVTMEIFKRWQDSDWAFFDEPGAQTREQQNEIMESADRIQGAWLRRFLENVFSIPPRLQTG